MNRREIKRNKKRNSSWDWNLPLRLTHSVLQMVSSKIILIKLRIYSLLELFGDFLSKYSITNPKVQKSGVKSSVHSSPPPQLIDFSLGYIVHFSLTSFFRITLGHLQAMWKPQHCSFCQIYMFRRVKHYLNKLWFIASYGKASPKPSVERDHKTRSSSASPY